MQWREHITTKQLAFKFGMTEEASVLLALRRLRWLGHVGRMTDDRMPKQILLGELLSTRPFFGPKLRWRDVIYGTLVLIPPLGMLQCMTVLDGMILARPLPPAVDPLLELLLLLLDIWLWLWQNFRRQGDLTCHHHFCDLQLPPSSSPAMEFKCDCGPLFHQKGDLTHHQHYCL